MNIDYDLLAHGMIGGGKKQPLPEVTDLIASQNTTGTVAILKWTNPTIKEFEKVHLYVSTSDISNVAFKDITTVATLVYSGTDSTTTHTTTPNRTNYYKVFGEFSVFGEVKYNGGSTVSITMRDTQPPSTITAFSVDKEDDKSVTLSWKNPTDSDFSKTRIMYKVGSYPTGVNDGTLAYEGTLTTKIVTGLTNDVVYYFRAFTYDTNGNVNTSTTNQQITGTPSAVKIYGVAIADNNTNPETAVTYIDNAVGMIGGSTSWDSLYPFNDIRPFLVKDGVEVVELNKNDFTKNISGGSVDITSGGSGDVMIRFPKIWWKMYKEGGNQYVKYATKQVDSSWKALAHINSRTGLECDYVYISAYLGYNDGSKLRSLSGKSPTTDTALSTFRTLSQANGANYNQIGFYQLTMLQILYLIRYKNLNSQTALGRGYVDGNTGKINTGGTNLKGMYYGENTGKLQMKFAGLEDFWGNCFYYIDGFRTNTSNAMQIATKDFNDAGTGATVYPSGISNTGGYMSDIQGTTETAFNIKTAGGSTTTRYSDYASLYGGYFAAFGGYWSSASYAGAFLLNVANDASGSSDVAARFALFK